VLASWLPAALGEPVSRAKLRRLIMAGAIRVGGRPLRRPGRPLRAGLALEARIAPERLRADRTAADRPFSLSDARLLHEDDVLLAVDKPPGLPTVPTADPRRSSLVAVVKAFLAARGAGGSDREPYLGVHQRLDRDTSGIVLFAKDPAANPGLAAAFSGHAVVKIYHALTARPATLPPHRWTAESAIGVHGKNVSACTELTRLRTLPRALLVEARPLTGRKHQIRIHLAEAGASVLGDELYGAAGRGVRVPRLMLHAGRLELAHPLTGKRLVIESPYPADFRRALADVSFAEGATRGRKRLVD
jgi:RluA family pseudouridine synthase